MHASVSCIYPHLHSSGVGAGTPSQVLQFPCLPGCTSRCRIVKQHLTFTSTFPTVVVTSCQVVLALLPVPPMPYSVIINTLKTTTSNQMLIYVLARVSIKITPWQVKQTCSRSRRETAKVTTTSRFIQHGAQYKCNTQSDDWTQSSQFIVLPITDQLPITCGYQYHGIGGNPS